MTVPRPVTMYDNRFCSQIDSPLYNGPLTTSRSRGFGTVGCPWRGTTTCFDCPYEPAALCDYKCRQSAWAECEHRAYCKCGHDQTHRLKAWELVP